MDRSNHHLDEELSACMDGELERSRRQFVLKRLTQEPEALQRWSRFHLMRSVLRQEAFGFEDLSERVSMAIEQAEMEEIRVANSRWLKPVAGGLIAASVAVVALIGMNHNLGQQTNGSLIEQMPSFISQSTPMDRVFSQPAVPVSLSEENQLESQRLRQLMLQHQQATRRAGVGGYWPIGTLAPEQKAQSEETKPTDKK